MFQQLPDDIPVVDDMSVVGHGTVPFEMMAGWFCVVISGSGLSPPVASSVEPSGTPSRPTLDRAPMVGDEADPVALETVVPAAQVPDAVPEMPAPSNKAVGADVPEIAPVADDSPFMAPVGAVELPAAPVEQADVDVIMPGVATLVTVGLTPGVANSVAPIGMPVVPTAAAGPRPRGDVRPSGGVTGAMPTWAKAAPASSSEPTMTTARMAFMGCVLHWSRIVRAAISARHERAGSGMRLKTDS
jgi:hypothetical protein